MISAGMWKQRRAVQSGGRETSFSPSRRLTTRIGDAPRAKPGYSYIVVPERAQLIKGTCHGEKPGSGLLLSETAGAHSFPSVLVVYDRPPDERYEPDLSRQLTRSVGRFPVDVCCVQHVIQ